MYLISACLLGINCRYDGDSKVNERILNLMKNETLIPVCPEQLGGMTTPRNPCQILNGRVVNDQGEDKTREFVLGAEETLKIAKLYNVKKAIMKQKSPSCGSIVIYDGTFSGKLISGKGIAVRVLEENGIEVFDEDNF